MKSTRFPTLLLCFLVPLLLVGEVAAQLKTEQKASLVLNADRTAYDAGSPARVAALVSIERGWHVNSNQPTFDYLIPTVLTLELPDGWKAGRIRYPQAQRK